MLRPLAQSESVIQIDKDIPRTFAAHNVFAHHDNRMVCCRPAVSGAPAD
jgi:hypothetical protein